MTCILRGAQIRALFRWVVHHIEFDVESFAHFRKARRAPPGQGAREVLRRRRATPFGFCSLLHALCREYTTPMKLQMCA
jgi:hypothetical protein